MTLHMPDGTAFHRAEHQKADGRRLTLYGYAPPPAPDTSRGLEGAGPGAELRWHPLLQEWSVYAAHRQNRTFMPSAAQDPLAPTRPGGPLTEVEAEAFEVAVFQNRFSSLHPQAALPPSVAGVKGGTAGGDCEVVVFAPEAEGSLATLGQARRRLLVSAWIDRYAHHHAKGAAFVMPFESRGAEVGVTLPHPHGQVYAFPFVPRPQRLAADAFAGGYDLAGALEDWGDYVVETAGPLVAFVPPFARYPYEVWIAGREPAQGPWGYGAEAFDAYAHLLGAVTARYDAFFGRPAATMMSLQAAPGGEAEGYQFATQFFCLLRAPDRLKYLATVEQATGVFTVDVMPEAAAKALREVL
jgi:UDPglucose--hexose-1-phosphate uridylyltransferase